MTTYHAWGWRDDRWNWLCRAESMTLLNPLLSAASDGLGIPDILCSITSSACPPVGRPAALEYWDALQARLKETHGP